MSLVDITEEDKGPLHLISQLVYAVGRQTSTGITLLGTAFAVAKGKFATAAHVTGASDDDLVLALPKHQSLLEYQNTSDRRVEYVNVRIATIDPFKDICILTTDVDKITLLYDLSGTDNVLPGDSVMAFGFPHADYGRLVLTQQNSFVGARILIESEGIKGKYIVLNNQARPGQSGSPVLNQKDRTIVAMIIGAYSPSNGSTMLFAGIDVRTLHQTTHAISAEYIKKMV